MRKGEQILLKLIYYKYTWIYGGSRSIDKTNLPHLNRIAYVSRVHKLPITYIFNTHSSRGSRLYQVRIYAGGEGTRLVVMTQYCNSVPIEALLNRQENGTKVADVVSDITT